MTDTTLLDQGVSPDAVAPADTAPTPEPQVEQTTPVQVEIVEKPKLDSRDEAEESAVRNTRAKRDEQLRANETSDGQAPRDDKGRFAPRTEKAATGGADGANSPDASVQTAPTDERKFRLKVNGKDVELPESEVIKRAQLAEAAQERFQTAAQMLRRAEELVRVNPPQAQTAQQQTTSPTGLDPAALARKLAYGTEDEVKEVIGALLNGRQQPSFDLNQVALQAAQVAQTQIAYQTGLEKFGSEFKDVTDDPHLTYIAAQYYKQLEARDAQTGAYRQPYERMKEAGELTRGWISQRYAPKAQASVTVNAQQLAAKDAAKRGAPSTMTGPNARAASGARSPKTPADIVREERIARGLSV